MAPVSSVFASVFDDLVLVPPQSERLSTSSAIRGTLRLSGQLHSQQAVTTKNAEADLPDCLAVWRQPRERWVRSTKDCLNLLQTTIDYYQDAALKANDGCSFEDLRAHGMRQIWPLISTQVPVDYYVHALTQVIVWVGSTLLQIVRPGEHEGLSRDRPKVLEALEDLFGGLQLIGLGRDRTAIAYAKATDLLLHLFVRRYRPESAARVKRTYFGMRDIKRLLDEDFIHILKTLMSAAQSLDAEHNLTLNGVFDRVEAARIKQLGCDKFAQLMANKLYKLITGGHMERDIDLRDDYKEVLETTTARNLMSRALQLDLAYHLLQPEVSTVEIIDVYVQIINALRQIDASNVVLERAASQTKRFLSTRDDAVRIVVSSLLQPSVDEEGHPVPSTEHFSGQVGRLMHEYISEERALSADMNTWVGKDLMDPNWQPEPIDAGPSYHKSRHYDAIGHMVTLKNSDEFAEELKALLQERLLQTDALNFEQEERLVTMFQLRFTDLKIPECEIMLKDMQDSRTAHTMLKVPQEFQAKILSRVYWPDPEAVDFVLPPQLERTTTLFNTAYTKILPGRQLQWHPSWARVTVELELEDRVFSEEVSSAQAAVINQFQNTSIYNPSAMQEDPPITRTIDQLATALNMETDLVQHCLAFWTSKLILQNHPPNTPSYHVIESLSCLSSTTAPTSSPTASSAPPPAPAPPAPAPTELKTGLDELLDQKDLYTNFITSMLTNQGDMSAARMHMMLRMIMPNGFPYEEQEFVEFLEYLAREGVVGKAGGLWCVGGAGG